uniref:Efflux RND transporter periplasmic adaptor subunit n=1 Tax=Vibrio algicola TaxID=2662262 RepID=A0A5Q0TAB6_9VIBR|nr:efflux RND transporter periplasmic adaptor subunit [Vibrio algicola]
MKKIPKKYWLIGLIVLAGCGSAYWYSKKSSEPLQNYATVKAHIGDIDQTVLANGMLQASKLVNIGAQVSGQIKNLAVNLGDEVQQGDLIAQIDDLTQQNNLKESLASLNSINAQIEAKNAQIYQAQLEFNRQKSMLAARASAKSDYDIAQATLAVYKAESKQLEAEKQQAKIKVDTGKVDLGYTTINAPINGTVVYTAVETGQTVNANQTTPTIIELAQLDTMTIKAQISEADVIDVKPGQAVYFTILGRPDQKYRATLRDIEPGPTLMDGNDSDLTISDSDAIYFNGLFDVKNPKRVLRIGMTAQVSIVLNQAKDTLLVPSQVLKKGPKGKAYQVPVLVNGKVEHRRVKVGLNNKVNAQILSGLHEGDDVVVGIATKGAPSPSDRKSRVRL